MTSEWSITHVSNLQTYVQFILSCPNTNDTKRISATYRGVNLQIIECIFDRPIKQPSYDEIIVSNIAIVKILKSHNINFVTKSAITIRIVNETKSTNIIFKLSIPIAYNVDTSILYPYALDYNFAIVDPISTVIVIPAEVVTVADQQRKIEIQRCNSIQAVKTSMTSSGQTNDNAGGLNNDFNNLNVNVEGSKYRINSVQNCESYMKIMFTCGFSGKKLMRIQHAHEGNFNQLYLAEYLPNGVVRYDHNEIKLQTDYPTVHICIKGFHVHVGDNLHIRIRNLTYQFDVIFIVKVPSKSATNSTVVVPHAVKRFMVTNSNTVSQNSNSQTVSNGIPSSLRNLHAPITLKQRSSTQDQDTATVYRRELLKDKKILLPTPDSFRVPPPLTASESIVLPDNVELLDNSIELAKNVETQPQTQEQSQHVTVPPATVVETPKVTQTSASSSSSTCDNSNPYTQQKLKRQHDDLSNSIEQLEAELRIKRKRLQATNEIIKSVVAADQLIAKLNSLN